MGFFDSIKGFGTAVFETLGQGVQAVLPSFIEAGAGALFGSLFPQQQPAGSQVFRRPALGPVQPRPRQQQGTFALPQLPPGSLQDVFARQPTRFPTGFPQTRPQARIAMPHFPGDPFQVTQASGSPFARTADFFDLPGIDLQLPFTADARTGGTPFFHGAGQVGQRPRSLIMQLNPSTGTPTFFRHAGRPIMFSGDRTLCKRIDKIARRAGRSRPRR